MPTTLPPLNAIRAFEAAARHESFALAADELHVTPGAISRQIKTLEVVLGMQLFARTNRQVRLTSESRTYFDAVTDALHRLDAATQGLLISRADRPLRIMCSMSFAMRWLLPRLPAFHARHPHIRISLLTTPPRGAADVEAQGADVQIRLGLGHATVDHASHLLFHSELVPVCSPRLLQEGPPLQTVADLRRHTLLHSELAPDAWARWLDATGAPAMDPKRATRFENSDLAHQAAIEGLGVALGERALISKDLQSGLLVLPLGLVCCRADAYYLFHQQPLERTGHLHRFRDWLVGEAQVAARPPGTAALTPPAPDTRARAPQPPTPQTPGTRSPLTPSSATHASITRPPAARATAKARRPMRNATAASSAAELSASWASD